MDQTDCIRWWLFRGRHATGHFTPSICDTGYPSYCLWNLPLARTRKLQWVGRIPPIGTLHIDGDPAETESGQSRFQ